MKSAVVYKTGRDGVAEVIFDSRSGKVNILTVEVMKELDDIIKEASSSGEIKTLLFKSGKSGIFIAGADIGEIAGIRSSEEAEEKSRSGQEIINKIAALPFTTVCVINGACLGGGLELALACDYRVVTDNPAVRLGMPETTLGIIPGFGGTWRLPRLIGLTGGLDLILSGRSVTGKEAFKYGLADALYTEAFLDERIQEFIKRPPGRKKRPLMMRFMENNPLGRAIIYSKAKSLLLKKTRGFYEAPLAALETVFKNYPKKLIPALAAERKAFSKTAVSAQARKLTGIYFLSEELKKAYKTPGSVRESDGGIRQAGLLGAGKMGGAIAWAFSNSDIRVRMKDISWQYVAAGYKAVRDIYNELEKRHKLDSRQSGLKMHKISGTVDYSGFRNADVVIEAIIEDKDEKIKTLRELENNVGDDTIIATNTSSFSIRELSAGLKRPERFLGFHFFNPVNRMPLVEVVRGEKTSDQVLYKMIGLARMIKKTPVLISDSSGFLVNRILMAYLSEAVMMMEDGIDFTMIDSAIYDYGMPLGPFSLMDEIGIKTAVKVAMILEKAYPDRAVNSKLMNEFVKSGSISGKSAGSGFYLYKKNSKVPNPAIGEILEKTVKGGDPVSGDEIAERCILRMINEAAFCLGEKIIENPGYLDMALILGTGYPPFRGGLLRSADEMGLERICGRLEELEEKFGKRYKAAPLLLEMKAEKGRFYK